MRISTKGKDADSYNFAGTDATGIDIKLVLQDSNIQISGTHTFTLEPTDNLELIARGGDGGDGIDGIPVLPLGAEWFGWAWSSWLHWAVRTHIT